MIIRKASPKDFGQLVRLTAAEGWNYQIDDFVRLQETGCATTLVAADGENVCCMITVFDYGDIGWISNVLVGTKSRGEGLGKRLIEEGIDSLSKKRAITLFTYRHAIEFYLKLGFKHEADYHFAKFLGHKGGVAMRAEGYDLVPMDREFFGYYRPGLLRMLGGIGEVLSPARGRGFAICRPDPVEAAVGPVVAEDRDAGLELLYSALNRIGQGCTAVLPTMVDGMEEIETVSRLFLGDKPLLDRSRVFALTGLEYG